MPTLAELAEDAAAYTPLWPGIDRVNGGPYCLLFLEWLTFVQRIRLKPARVEQALADVRARMAERGRTRAMWWLGNGSRPADLRRRLLDLGLEPLAPEPLLGMALDGPPQAEPTVEVRPVTTLADYLTALRIEHEVNEVSEEARTVTRAEGMRQWTRLRSSPLRHYLALVDGEPVAMGRAAIGDAVFLMGGATLPRARGRGAYTALVAERWRAGGGRPLVAQAGPESRPILAKLGFHEVGEIHILVDEIGVGSTEPRKAA
jgi:hypothetical protein